LKCATVVVEPAGILGGYRFGDAGLLRLALTHRSSGLPHNERLEFLGDAVLGLVIGELLYRRFPELDEGALSRLRSRLVSGEYLAGIAQTMNLPDRVRLGSGERKGGGARRKTILAGALEAIIGAVYLDGGLAACLSCIERWFAEALAVVARDPGDRDEKTRLQELLQARGEPLPVYVVVVVSGPEHARQFKVSCTVSLLEIPVSGTGGSRREAEKQAATAALAALAARGAS
jgi:ribonuclease-3